MYAVPKREVPTLLDERVAAPDALIEEADAALARGQRALVGVLRQAARTLDRPAPTRVGGAILDDVVAHVLSLLMKRAEVLVHARGQ
jgi:hypothetical protein